MIDTTILASFVKDQRKWLDNTEWKSLFSGNDTEQYADLIQGDIQITSSGGVVFGNRSRIERPQEGKDPSPGLFKEKLRNNSDLPNTDNETYNDDVIPLCTYQSMSYDPKINLGTRLICGFVSRLSYSIESKDEKIKAVVEAGLRPIYSKLVRDMVNEGLKNGFMFGEKIWSREELLIYDRSITGKKVVFKGQAVVPIKIKTLDPELGYWRYFVNSTTDELTRVEQQQSQGPVSIKRNKVFWFALDRQYSYIFGTSRYKNSYQSWFYSSAVKSALLQKLDKTGDPPVMVEFPEGKTRVGDAHLWNDEVAQILLENVISKKGFVKPSLRDDKGNPKWNVTFLEIKNDQPGPYLDVLEMLDKEKVEGLGIFGNIIAGDGNFSEIDAKEDLTLVMIEDIVDQIEAAIQTELVDWIVSYNFGPQAISDVKFKIDRNSLGRTKVLKEILKELMRVLSSDKTNMPKMMPNIKEICDQLGIPIAPYNDLIITRPQPEIPAAPSQPGAPQGKPNNLVKEAQKSEDSNDRNRASTSERDKTRPSDGKIAEK